MDITISLNPDAIQVPTIERILYPYLISLNKKLPVHGYRPSGKLFLDINTGTVTIFTLIMIF